MRGDSPEGSQPVCRRLPTRIAAQFIGIPVAFVEFLLKWRQERPALLRDLRLHAWRNTQMDLRVDDVYFHRLAFWRERKSTSIEL